MLVRLGYHLNGSKMIVVPRNESCVCVTGWTNRLRGICGDDEEGQWRNREENNEKQDKPGRCPGTV